MKNRLFYFVVIVIHLVAASCQKELEDGGNNSATGYLIKDANGNCSLVGTAGIYKANKTLTDSNRLLVTVNITKTGTYTLKTDTVNGCFFKSSNHFTQTGAQTISLRGNGTPAIAGTFSVSVRFDTSICTAKLTVLPATQMAVYTLAGAPNGCTNALLSGVYAQNILLDTAAYATITVNVSTPGFYVIFTNTVNGYIFYGSGTLTATGIQTVRLSATGLPATVGTDVFTIDAGITSCSFPVTVGATIPASAGQYFPLADSSYWVYDDLQNPTDSIVRTVAGTQSANGTMYTKVTEQRTGTTRPLLFVKSSTNYLEYGKADQYTVSFLYSPIQETELLFLKENVSAGTTWQSPEYNGNASFGQLIYLRYNYYCEAANTSLTVNGRSFTNVHKISMYPEIRSQFGNWGGTSELYNMYYAKGIGLIYFKKTNMGYVFPEMAIKRWRVN